MNSTVATFACGENVASVEFTGCTVAGVPDQGQQHGKAVQAEGRDLLSCPGMEGNTTGTGTVVNSRSGDGFDDGVAADMPAL